MTAPIRMVSVPPFGAVVENGWASEDNPTRRGFFVREFKRTGRMNPGQTWEITDGKGKFWEFKPSDIGERLKVTDTAAPVREEGGAVEAVGANAGSVNGRLVHAIDLIAKGLYLARGGTEDAYKVEGGEGPSVYGAGKVHRRINEVRGEAYRVVMAWRKSDPFSSKPALPTREAPAEAGAALGRLSALLSASHLAGDAAVAGLGAVSWNDLRAVLDAALRAQPQAREEVQPVAWDHAVKYLDNSWRLASDFPPDFFEEIQSDPKWSVQPLYTTPPAPEAEKLRVAVEALKEAGSALESAASFILKKWGSTNRARERAIGTVRQALAALQQEGRDGG